METPYYAVIFTSRLVKQSPEYEIMAPAMETLAKKQDGFLGLESARNTIGITVSYWETEEAIVAWKNNLEHQMAQKLGKQKWYKSYHIRICKVTREYTFTK